MKYLPSIPGEPEIIHSVKAYSSLTECSVAYDIYQMLLPRQAILLDIPTSYQSRILDLITLAHRKTNTDIAVQEWDPEPAYSRVLALDKKTKSWVYWGAQQFDAVSFGDKLAEPRGSDNPEVESLHDWVAYSGLIFPQKICIINSGKGEHASSELQYLIVDFFPIDMSVNQTEIFSHGTVFVDLKKNVKEQFGGGVMFRGQYPNAVAVNSSVKPSFPLSEKGDNYYLKDKKLHIVVDHSYCFTRIEIAVGDTKDTGEFNKDGHIGTLGCAKLDIELQQKKRKQVLAQQLNVPPQGILKVSPKQSISVSEGDEFIISAKDDPAYVMGVRIQ